MPAETKVLTKRRKFIDVEIPILDTNLELIGNTSKDAENRTIKLDLTRQLKGKSVEGTFKVIIKNDKALALPVKIKLMPYFIRRMIRKRISYVEDSFSTKSQESMLIVKPFLITRKRVSRAVRKTLRNKARNWLEDYLSQKTDEELFTEILSNKLQKSLSLMLKKTYPLSLCEIRIFEIQRPLSKEEIPEKKILKEEKPKKITDIVQEEEEEKVKEAEAEIKKTQKKAAKKQKEIGEEETEDKTKEETETKTEQKPEKKKKSKKKSEEGV
jgi:ribosomal protein S3AE